MHKVRVVAFDLDDTLIRLAPDFVPQYIDLLSSWLGSAFPGIPVALDRALIDVSTQMMAKERDQERMEDFFYRHFSGRTGLARERLEPVLASFYRQQFPMLRRLSRPVYGALGLLAAVKARGYRVALLTSALFPEEAIRQRLYWAGLDAAVFDWKSALELVHATKPQPGYYKEAADALAIGPGHWLMVGNDVVEDIVPAHQAGMAVYWATEQTAADNRIPPGTPRGPVEKVLEYLP